MMLLCKKSKSFWQHNENAIEQVFKQTKWRDYRQDFEYLIQKYDIDDLPEFDQDYSLILNCRDNYNKVYNFMKKSKDFDMPDIFKLSINSMYMFEDQHLSDISKFFNYTTPHTLQVLSLDSGIPDLFR